MSDLAGGTGQSGGTGFSLTGLLAAMQNIIRALNNIAQTIGANILAGNNTWSGTNTFTGSAVFDNVTLPAPQVQSELGALLLYVTLPNVSLNSATTDFPITIPTPPTGTTRFVVQALALSGASGNITAGTVGLFTATGGGGIAIAALQAPTVTTAADGTNNNYGVLALTNAETESYTRAGFPTLQFRVGVAVAGATVSVTLQLGWRP